MEDRVIGRFQRKKRSSNPALNFDQVWTPDSRPRGQKHMPQVFIAIGVAVGTALGTTAIVGTTALLVGIGVTALTVALPFVMRAIIGVPKFGDFSSQQRGFTGTIQQSDAPRRIIYGRRLVGPILTDHYPTPDNLYWHFVHTLAGRQCNAVTKFYANNEELTTVVDGTYLRVTSSKYANLVWFEVKLGAAGEAAFPGFVAESSGHWTTDHKQEGCCSVHVKLKWDANAFSGGIPNFTYLVEGALVYDPRTALTAWSNNSVLCARDYFALAKDDGGFGWPAGEIDDTVTIAGANVCDEAVPLKAGGTEPRYTCNGAIDLGRGNQTDIQEILSSCDGRVSTVGNLRIYPGYWQGSTLSVGDDDFLAPIKWDSLLGRRDQCNSVKGKFVCPDNNWASSDFPPVSNATYVTEDGGDILWDDIQLPFTTSSATAQRLGKIHLERKRRQGNGRFVCKLRAFQVIATDVVEITHARFGFTSKTVEVIEPALVPLQQGDATALAMDLTVNETDSHIWDWTAATDEDEAVAAIIVPGPNLAPAAPSGVALTSDIGTAVQDAHGFFQPRIRVTWTASTDAFVLSGGKFMFQYRQNGTSGAWIPGGEADGSSTEHYIAGVQLGTSYDVRIWAVNAASAPGPIVTDTAAVTTSLAPPDVTNFAIGTLRAPSSGYAFSVQFDKPASPAVSVRVRSIADVTAHDWSLYTTSTDIPLDTTRSTGLIDAGTQWNLVVKSGGSVDGVGVTPSPPPPVTIMIKTLDSAGQESVHFATIWVTDYPASGTGSGRTVIAT